MVAGGSSNGKSLIIHPGGGRPDFELSVGAVSFKVGRPGQGVNTLATAGFSDLVDLKVGTSLAKAGNVHYRHFSGLLSRKISSFNHA